MFDHIGLGVSDYEASKQYNGAPGLRPHHHANYDGAFVIGPDGHNVEAVCHPPSPSIAERT